MALHTSSPLFLMCPPDYFQLTPPDPEHGFANDMIAHAYEDFVKNPEAFIHTAKSEWEALKDIIENQLKAKTELLTPQEDMHDQCFTADASLSFVNNKGNEITLISTMTHPLRTPETAYHEEKIRKLFPQRPIEVNPLPSEGTGDNLFDPYRNLFWSGYTPDPCSTKPAEGRSDIRAHHVLADKTGMKVISLEVERPFFHVDTTLAALPKGHLLYYKGGMTDEAFKTLKKEGIENFDLNPDDYLIEVTKEEAYLYACNLIYVGNKVVLTECGERLPNLLREKGYEIFTTDLSCFIQAGGGPHCLTNNLTLNSANG